MNIILKYLPEGHPNRPMTKMTAVKARIFHGTANINPGADDLANVAYFARKYIRTYNRALGKYEYFEADGVTPFRYGSAHVVVDVDSATVCIPLDEACVGAGDRPLPYDNGNKGQTAIARSVFNYNQNRESIQIELAMNNMTEFDKVLDNAIEFCCKMVPDTKLLNYRHGDVTGKMCPSPLFGTADKNTKWTEFTKELQSKLIAATIKDPVVNINGVLVPCGARIINGITTVQLRPVAEALGKSVTWDGNTRTIYIK